MKGSHPHQIYSRDATVYLVSGEEKFDTFHRAVERSGFVSHLLSTWEHSGKAKEEFLISIKPNMMIASGYEENSPVYTDPGLVEVTSVFLRIALVGIIMMSFEAGLMFSLSGAGDTLPPMLFAILSMWAVPFPLAYLLPRVTDLGVYGVRWGIVTAIVLRAITYAIYFKAGRWKRKKV